MIPPPLPDSHRGRASWRRCCEWMAQGRVGGSLLAGEWHDIGTVARLQALDEQLQGRTH